VFYRIKKIKGREYCYFVENKWTSKGSRQKKSKYIGKVIKVESEDKPLSVISHSAKGILKELINWELKKTGGPYVYDEKSQEIKYKNKPIVLEVNGGFLCKHSITRLMKIKLTGDQEEKAYKLAKNLLDAGIAIPKEVFVQLFTKYE